MRTLIGKRTFRLPIPTAGLLQAKEFTLPSDVQSVTGIAVTSKRRDLAWARGTLGLFVAGEELIVDGEDASEYMFGSDHPARTFAFGELPIEDSNRSLKLRYQDSDVTGHAFSAYDIAIVVTYTKQAAK